jgi:hypothetical protein
MSIASNRKPKTLSRKTNTVVIGVGNAYGGDDAAGLVAAQRLAQLASDEAMILTETGDAARLIEFWKGANKVIILDAVSSGAGPGTPRRLLRRGFKLEELPLVGLSKAYRDDYRAERYELAEWYRSLSQRAGAEGFPLRIFLHIRRYSDH